MKGLLIILGIVAVIAGYVLIFFYLPYYYNEKFKRDYYDGFLSWGLSAGTAVSAATLVFVCYIDMGTYENNSVEQIAFYVLIAVTIGLFLLSTVRAFIHAYQLSNSVGKSIFAALCQVLSFVGIAGGIIFVVALTIGNGSGKKKKKK